MRRLLLLFLALSPLSFAQQGIHNYTSSVTQQIVNLVTSGQPVFMSFGTKLLTSLGVIMLVIYGLKWALASASNYHGHFDFPGMVYFFCLFIMAEMMLRFYNTPLPWVGSSFSQLLPDTAMQFARAVSLGQLNTLVGHFDVINKALETQPLSITNISGVTAYLMVFLTMLMIQGVLFAVTITGIVAVGIGTLLGPIFIPWLVIPRMSWLFWSWLSFMLVYSFYQVIAAALVYVWTNVFVTFISSAIAGNYTLTHFATMIVPLGVLAAGMLFTVFKVGQFSVDLLKGGASAGAGFGNSVLGTIKGLFG